MPHTNSAKKRLRQTKKRRLRNRMTKSTAKTFIKRFDASLDAEKLKTDEGKKEATEAFRLAVKKLDQAVAKGTLHRNTVARRKSQLARRLNTATAAKS